MSIHDKLAAVADELHLTGFGSELTEGVKRVAGVLADEIQSLGGGDVAGKVEQLVKDEIAKLGLPDGDALDTFVKARVTLALGDVDQRVTALFNDLLAKAAAADAAKVPPVAAAPAAAAPADAQPAASEPAPQA